LKAKSKKKYYLVVSKNNSWLHGAFDHSESGLEKAEKYLKNLIKKSKDKSLRIVEK
jgi:hypothetical protein